MPALLLLKGLFTGLFGFLFRDWRVTLLIVILAVAGWFTWHLRGQFKDLQADLAHTQQVLKVEQDNNVTLRGNLDIAVKTNQENDKIIESMRSDAKLTQQQVATLNTKVANRNKQIDDLKNQLSKLPAEPLTPNIKSAVTAIQQMRDERVKEQGK